MIVHIKQHMSINNEIRKIKEKKRVEIQNQVVLTDEQIGNIQDFYRGNYGKNILLNWHKNYYAVSGNFDYKFFPECIYIPIFENILNSPKYYECLQDKNVTELLFKSLGCVKTCKYYLKSSNGLVTDENYNIIDKDTAISILKTVKRFFIKPTIDSNSGKKCYFCNLNEQGIDLNSGKFISDIVDELGKDFVAQEVIKNRKDIACFNPSSLNTFRIITYILNGSIYHMPILLRIGREGSHLDNAHAGGIFVGIEDDGTLLEFAHSEFGGNYSCHPDTGVKFKGCKIQDFQKIIDASHKLQASIPYVGCVNWDMTFDENGDVVLIEANMRGGSIWLSQMAHGKGAFGENTEEVLRLCKKNKPLY